MINKPEGYLILSNTLKEVGVELTNESFISEIMYSDYEYVVLSMIIAQEIMNMASLFYVSKILRVQIC